MKQYSSEELRAFVQGTQIPLRELSSEINYSPSTLSLWLRDIYPNDATQLEASLARWANAQTLTARDRRKFSYISDLLEHADDKQAIIDTILQNARSDSGRPKTTKRSSSGVSSLPLADGIDRD